MLKAEKLTKTFNNVKILKGVDVEIQPGHVTFIIGPSGAGKTTLLRSLALLDRPDSGNISIDGKQYSFPLSSKEKFTPPWPELTVVFQQHFLWPHLTIRQNITLPLAKRVGDHGEDLDELISTFNMSSFIDRYPNQASVGERQRAALARALILKPRYVLLDEITSSLDVEQIAHVFEHLLDLRRRGIGILVITHLLGFAQSLLEMDGGDEVLFLERGSVLERGGIEVLESSSNLRVREFLSQVKFAS